jgi:hypothetical protein
MAIYKPILFADLGTTRTQLHFKIPGRKTLPVQVQRRGGNFLCVATVSEPEHELHNLNPVSVDREVVCREIQSLVAFEGYNPWDGEMRTAMPEILKQLLAHEVRQARIRCLHKRDVQGTETASTPMAAHLKQHIESMTAAENYKLQPKDSDAVPAISSDLPMEDMVMTQQTSKAVASHSFLIQAAEKSRAAEIARRRISIAAAEATKKAVVTSARGKYPVIYKYQEGFTNAVRRPVRVSDFL